MSRYIQCFLLVVFHQLPPFKTTHSQKKQQCKHEILSPLVYRFIRHPVARSSDFSTHPDEGPVIAQFASNDPVEFGRAAEMIGPWVNGVDLNCGCPQSWALKEGIGCSMMSNPAKVAAMIKEAKQRIGHGKTVSCKIRIHKDLKYRSLNVCGERVLY
jgi:tRNA-dihydrouridine synthase